MTNELYHHGVLGMKWGVRRYQSYDTVPRGSGEGGKEIGLAKKKSLYDRNYHTETSRFGKSSIRDESGNKMKYGTRRKIEKQMKKELKKTDKEQYREYKQAKKAAGTSFSYIGNSSTMALMTMGLNAVTKDSRDLGKKTVNEMITKYANTKFEDFVKNSK